MADVTDKERRLVQKKKLAEDHRMKECSFRPKINKKRKFKKVESHYSQKNYEKKMDEYLQKKQLEVINQTKLKIREIFWQKKVNGMSSENALSNLILKLKMNHQG